MSCLLYLTTLTYKSTPLIHILSLQISRNHLYKYWFIVLFSQSLGIFLRCRMLPPTESVSECNFSSFSRICIVLPGILHMQNKLILIYLFQVFNNLAIAIKWVFAVPFVGLWIVEVEQVKGIAIIKSENILFYIRVYIRMMCRHSFRRISNSRWNN